MARPASQEFQQALEAYEIAIAAGCSPADALAAARQAVGDRWSDSLAASLSRKLKDLGTSRPGSGGDHRPPLVKAVRDRIRSARAELRSLQTIAASEVSLTVVDVNLDRDLARQLHRTGKPVSMWRRHEIDGLQAGMVATQEGRRGVRDFWGRMADEIRHEAWRDIQRLVEDSDSTKESLERPKTRDLAGQAVLERARRELFGPIDAEEVPMITAWAADAPLTPRELAHVVLLDDNEPNELSIVGEPAEAVLSEVPTAGGARRNRNGNRWSTQQVAGWQ